MSAVCGGHRQETVRSDLVRRLPHLPDWMLISPGLRAVCCAALWVVLGFVFALLSSLTSWVRAWHEFYLINLSLRLVIRLLPWTRFGFSGSKLFIWNILAKISPGGPAVVAIGHCQTSPSNLSHFVCLSDKGERSQDCPLNGIIVRPLSPPQL